MTIKVIRSEDHHHQEIVDKRTPQSGLYYVIPSFVMECGELEHSEIVFYALVSGLAINKGYCFASDEYLAERMRVDERTVRNWFSKLEKLQFLKRETIKKGMYWDRKIYIILHNSNNSYERTCSSGSKGTPVPDRKDAHFRKGSKVNIVSKEKTEPNRTEPKKKVANSYPPPKKESDRIGSDRSFSSKEKEEKPSASLEEIEMVIDHASSGKIRLKHSDVRQWVSKYGLEKTIQVIDLAIQDMKSGSLLTNPPGWITNALKKGY